MNSIHTLLIANRGEIACRIIKTCRKLGIQSVAVFSNADAQAPFVKMADKAIALGGLQASESYLVQDKIIAAAHRSGANAIHPGYGFLSENAAFAERCEKEGIIFVGPNSKAIQSMGSKSKAKAIMQEHGVPVIPGYRGEDQRLERLMEEAQKVGYPLLLKAVAGGGGKGMRIVERTEELKAGIEAAKREAKSAFGDDELLIEKYFPSARHIEFQIFGDKQGNAIHLLERECSIQRRYQKVLEESPSSILSEEKRTEMGKAAVLAAKAIAYDNAGTVEFIYTDSDDFYFLEVNTRLQVEHPVTEYITGLDLVEWQILVAEGASLPLQQHEIQSNGYALECRLYAEDPSNQFFPATGTIALWETPQLEGLRYDTGIETGSEVSIYYDPMIAKIIAHGPDRSATFRKMQYALQQVKCLGLTTNQNFLIQLLQHPKVKKGQYDTHFIAQNPALTQPTAVSTTQLHEACISICLKDWQQRQTKRSILKTLPSGWRNNFYQPQQITFGHKDENYTVNYRSKSGLFEISIGDQNYMVKIIETTINAITLEINQLRQTFYFAQQNDQYFVHHPSIGAITLQKLPRFPEVEEEVIKGGYQSPMPGEILQVLVKAGQKVKEGESLLILSSMKMENTISADADGEVEEVFVEAGETIEAGFLLLKIK